MKKAEMKYHTKAAYKNFLEASRVYGDMKNEYHAGMDKLTAYNSRSSTIGFTCHYHSNQQNNHFTKTEIAQAYLDIVEVTSQMWDEILQNAYAAPSAI